MKTNGTRNEGFTLLEMLISVTIVVIVAGVALALVAKSMPLYNRQQGMAALNLGLRGAIAQIEQDVVNAGTGYYVGINFPDWPVGVTIIKAPGGTCYDAATHTYGDPCFDTLNVITTDLTTPPANLNTNLVSNGTTVDVKTPSTVNPATGAPWTAAEYAAKFLIGDQMLLLNSAGSQLTTFKLTANGAVLTAVPPVIRLAHAATNSDGTNGNVVQADALPCTQSTPPANDYLGITLCKNAKVGASFVANDWVLKLASVTYKVDATDNTKPKLARRVGPPGGALETVADQIIGFKVGASIWNTPTNGTDNYIFDPALYPDDTPGPAGNGAYNYSRVRSVRVSLIGRTTPSTDPTNPFRNTFDGGRYQIRGASVIVNPRNLSMRDN